MATTERTNENLVRDFHERILSRKDLAAAEELLAADYVEHNPALPGGEVRGREEMVRFWEDLFEAFPDLDVSEEDVLSEGERVVTRHTGRGTHEGEFMGVEPTGNEFEVEGIDLYRIEDGRIAEAWVSIDLLGMMEQLGVAPER